VSPEWWPAGRCNRDKSGIADEAQKRSRNRAASFSKQSTQKSYDDADYKRPKMLQSAAFRIEQSPLECEELYPLRCEN